MSVMTQAEVLGLPRGRALTRDDLATMPDDGHRYELINGILIVSPAPKIRHQDVVRNLIVQLAPTVPTEMKLLPAPVDVILDPDTVIQPDLLVASREDFTDRDLPSAPLLAIEVLSPSTRSIDLLLKKERLQQAGCQHYWVVDPDEPSMTAWKLADGNYVEITAAIGDETFTVSDPLDATLRPVDLIN